MLDQRSVIDADTARIAAAAYVIGAHGAMTGTAYTFFKRADAELMRLRRATSSEEQTLRAAIKSELEAIGGTVPSARPNKDARAILDRVNARLRECGMKPVLEDVIARRLKPRSSRARKK